MKRRWVVPVALAAFVVLSGAARTFAQVVQDVYPVEPEDGGRIGKRATFKIGVEGTDPQRMSFRILLSRDGFDTIAYTFDQKQDRNGWAFFGSGNPTEVVYYTRKPLDGGAYEWKASAWNGMEWVDGKKTFKLLVDVVPPADVRGLRVNYSAQTGSLTLDWDPVSTDQEGRSESVVRYHIYRYERKQPFFVIRAFEVGTVTEPPFVDSGKTVAGSTILFYKVTAEDDVGNEPERRF